MLCYASSDADDGPDRQRTETLRSPLIPLLLTLCFAASPHAHAQDDAATGTLTVTASVAGAHVYIDYEDRGEAPVDLQLAPGRYNVRVALDNHEPFVRMAEITPGGAAAVDAQLLAGDGTVEFIVKPSGAAITIDDEPVGKAPRRLTDFTEGEHTYSLSVDRYEPFVGTFDFIKGQNILLVHELEAASGSIGFATDPEGATIFVNGVEACVSPCEAKADPGLHQVRAELKGHATVLREVDTTQSLRGEFTAGLSEMHGTQVFKARGASDVAWSVNGQPMGEGKSLKTTLDRGTYKVQAEAPGAWSVEKSVVVEREGRAVWKATLEPSDSQDSSTLVEGTPLVKNWIFWTAVGVGATGAGIGAAVALQPEEPEPLPSGDVVVSLP